MDGQPSHVPTVAREDTVGDAAQLPACALDAMWKSRAMTNIDSRALPPPCHLEDALSQLRITLLPKVQHNAVHSVSRSQIVEPTLVLFCPIEGGEYVIDATVKELAEKTNSEVQVIDMAQVAADRWGVFGESASGLKMTDYLLSEATSPDNPPGTPCFGRFGTGAVNPSVFEAFWNKVIKCDPPTERTNLTASLSTTPSEAASGSPTQRPRIVYIRDFGLLASQAPKWFPSLYSAIRARRTGGLGPEFPISHPTTIVFGFCPYSSAEPSYSSGSGRRRRRSVWSSGAAGFGNHSDTEAAQEKRLKERFEKWDDGTLLDDLPEFTPHVRIMKSNAGPGIKLKSKADLVEQTGITGDWKTWTPNLDTAQAEFGQVKPSDPDAKNPEEWVDVATKSEDAKQSDNIAKSTDDTTLMYPSSPVTNPYCLPSSFDFPPTPPHPGYTLPFQSDVVYEQTLDGYFRSCIIAPAKRNIDLERTSRESRLQELNELRLRIVVGTRGGVIEDGPGLLPLKDEKEPSGAERDGHGMITGLDKHLLDLSKLNAVADRAIEASMLSDQGRKDEGDMRLNWAELREAWRAHQAAEENRIAWKANSGFSNREGMSTDEVIAKVRSEGLDDYERQWIEYAVGPAQLATAFEDVYLPSETVDTIRSTVFLPLLYPEAFQSGTLKDQANNGVLLFGPSGTGKALVVKAIAKESGSRMLTVNQSTIANQHYLISGQCLYGVFKLAQRLKPCIVFIEGIETIENSETSNLTLLNHFVQAFDRLTDPGVIVIGATERPFDINHAILRHLTCRLLIDLPALDVREKILRKMLRDEKLAADVNISELAKRTYGFNGFDLKNLCVTAAREALKDIIDFSRPSREDGLLGASKPDIEQMQTGHVDDSVNGSKLQARILAATHFTRALTRIPSFGSDAKDTLIEIRKWNGKFGTGSLEVPDKGIHS